ncbi:MAG: hypothetical protein ACRDPY_02885 [Streptosporangiaceae bacterium]
MARKTEEERAAEDARKQAEAQRVAAEREAARVAAEQEAARMRYLASPMGQADTARQRGDRFFQISLKESEVEGKSSDWGYSQRTTTTRVRSATDVLGQIEELGWHLEHVGYVFVETGAVDRNKAFSGGTVTRTNGYVQGTYLFRAVEQRAESGHRNAGVWPGGQRTE